jgi:hypothetical protein
MARMNGNQKLKALGSYLSARKTPNFANLQARRLRTTAHPYA